MINHTAIPHYPSLMNSAKLAKLRDEGVISEAEFVHMKYNLIRRT